jgi:hypothetical protein
MNDPIYANELPTFTTPKPGNDYRATRFTYEKTPVGRSKPLLLTLATAKES